MPNQLQAHQTECMQQHLSYCQIKPSGYETGGLSEHRSGQTFSQVSKHIISWFLSRLVARVWVGLLNFVVQQALDCPGMATVAETVLLSGCTGWSVTQMSRHK